MYCIVNAFLRTKPGIFCSIGRFKDVISELPLSSLCWIFITLDVKVGVFAELCRWIMSLFYNIYIGKLVSLPILSDGY